MGAPSLNRNLRKFTPAPVEFRSRKRFVDRLATSSDYENCGHVLFAAWRIASFSLAAPMGSYFL